MGWKLLIAFAVVLLLSAGALAIYGANVSPPKKTYEQVLPDSNFPK